MATKTSLLGLTKPAYTDAADIAVLNGNFDLIDTAVGSGKHVRNELDNSHFAAARFIAQAGLDEYHGSVAYLGDRWRSHVSITATAQTNGLMLNSVTQHAYVYQKVQLQIGKTYTFAVRASSMTASHRIAVYNGGLGIYVKEAYSSSEGTLVASFTAAYEEMAMLYYPGYASGGGSSVIEWAALYEGAYTAETLPAYVYKGYAAELAECRRYYRPPTFYNLYCYSAGYLLGTHFDMPMRTQPTATVIGVYTAAWGALPGETSATTDVHGEGINAVTNMNFTAKEFYRVEIELFNDL